MRRILEDIRGCRFGARNTVVLIVLRRVALAAIAALAIMSGGCSHGGSGQPSPAASAAVQALPPQLQGMLERVAGVRGLAAPPNLKAGFVSRSTLPALMDRLTTADDRRVFAQTTTLYRLVGHLRADQDFGSVYRELTADAVAGLYSPQDKALWVVHPDGAAIDLDHLSRDQASTLAHELTHAVQDSQADLLSAAKRVEDNLDANLAWTCVVEGDAVATERVYSAKYLAVPLGRGAVALIDLRKPMPDVPASIARELYFPYQEGADWIAGIRQRQGNGPIDAMLAQPPAAGTAAILHPDRFNGGLAPPEVALPGLATALGRGWSRESGGTFGEFELRNYLQLRLPASQAVLASDGWSGDHYDVYISGSASVAVFRIRFASAAEAQQFRDTQAKFLATMTVNEHSAGNVTVTATNDGHATARLERGAPDEALFVIGSTADIAEKAARTLAGG
jgi:hypothetical protein